ncbi:hypothetical protein [Paraburkholderia sp. BR14374]|uniref:hypothetical protein n=1 Tax=Paraburkholderia sp. BR14374 TaxID=3237007 RepID=UPI0034CD2E1F
MACLQEKRSGAGRAKEWRRLYVIWWGTAGYKVSKPQKTLASLYQVSRLYINFLQPSFKLKSKTGHGAKVTKRYEASLTPPEKDGYPRIESVRGMAEFDDGALCGHAGPDRIASGSGRWWRNTFLFASGQPSR